MIEENKDARNWAVLCHLSALLWLVGVPFGNILGPLIVWLIKKNDYPFVDDQGKEALNFHISLTIYLIGAMILFVLFGVSMLPLFWPFHHGFWDFWNPLAMPFFLIPGIALVIGIFVLGVVFAIVAAVKASDGVAYRYPITLRLIR
jgi:uncharacterized Tic20 family protein